MQTEVHHKAHHDSRPYEVASKESADKARAKLEMRFSTGNKMMLETLNNLDRYVPSDFLVPSSQASFAMDNEHLVIDLGNGADSEFNTIHPHAMGQLYEKAGIPKPYADRLIKEDPDLLMLNLERRYGKQQGKKYLARVVDNKLLGWLSDSYGRYDAQPMIEAFLLECKRFGAVPVESRHLETKVYMKMMLPRIFEPVPNEVLAFGAQISTSDFGDGALDARLFVERVWCTNDAMSEEMLRKIHLGAKLTSENFSQETLGKQASMLASAVRDVVRAIFAPAHIEARLEMIKQADENMVPIKETLEAMRRNSRLTKAEVARLQEMPTVSDTELLPSVRTLPPKGQTSAYRLANALGLLAHQTDEVDGHRMMDLELLSGELMGLMKGKKVKEEVEDSELALA